MKVQSVDDDDSVGDFDLTAALNDPSVILNWYYTDEIIDPLVDIEFNVTVYDVDNTSAELSVLLYYSDTVFYLTNVSVSLEFRVENSPQNYTYIYGISGQRTNTKIHYYYTVDDGATLQRKPDSSDEFYDILWSAPAVTIIRHYDDVDVIQQIIDISPLAVLFLLITVSGMIFVAGKKKQ